MSRNYLALERVNALGATQLNSLYSGIDIEKSDGTVVQPSVCRTVNQVGEWGVLSNVGTVILPVQSTRAPAPPPRMPAQWSR